MIGAGNDPGPAGAREQLMGPMRADVIETAQQAILAAADEDVLVMDGCGDVAPGLRQIGDMAGEMPVAEEDRLALPRESLRRGIEMGGQSERAGRIAIERPVASRASLLAMASS